MKTKKLHNYLDTILKKTTYKYDPSIKMWCGWVKNIPGIYAQNTTIKKTRTELFETLEEYFLFNIKMMILSRKSLSLSNRLRTRDQSHIYAKTN